MLGVHRRGRVVNARFKPKVALKSKRHKGFGELLSSCSRTCLKLASFPSPDAHHIEWLPPVCLVKTSRTGLITGEKY